MKTIYHDTVTNKLTANHREAVEWSRLGHKIDLYKYRKEFDDYIYATNWTVEYEQAKSLLFFIERMAGCSICRAPSAVLSIDRLYKFFADFLCILSIVFLPKIWYILVKIKNGGQKNEE